MLADGKKIRVLVVDDSAVMRKLITSLLEHDPEIEVVATAIDGSFAINKVDQLHPDVVTLDVDMPRVDGLTALKEIVARHTVPVVMLSSLTTRGARLALQALELGAMDFVCKPKAAAQIGEVAEELILKVKTAARSRQYARKPATNGQLSRKTARVKAGKAPLRVIAIGASSGGPNALRQLLPKLPADFPVPILLVQHLPESFTGMFAKWLDERCEVSVKEARDGMLALPGTVVVAPGNAHLKVRRRPVGVEVVIENSRPVNGHMPSVDVLFRSVAREFGENGAGLLMTGMGSDGAEGIGELKSAGGHTMAQDKESCMIFGMPRVAISKGYIDQVLPLNDMASYLISAVGL